MLGRLLLVFLLLAFWNASRILAERPKTIYQKIQQESEYSGFSDLVKNNRVAKLNLHYEPLTVFVPQNAALDNYEGDTYPDLAFYHMSFEVKTLEQLQNTNVMSSVNLDNPPLWITKVNNDIYVNSAKIVKRQSNYISRSRSGDTGHQQVLHMIDMVLNPMIRSPNYSPNAYNFLSATSQWDIGQSKRVTKFYQRVQQNRLLDRFNSRELATFFIPIDSGIDPNTYNKIDKEVVLRHLVPNYVLFSRPSEKNIITMGTEDPTYSLSFEKKDKKLFVRCLYKDNSKSGFEEFSSEIVVADIPVKNGVIHLIAQPFGNFKERLHLFPYWPLVEKITNDPELDIFYKWGTMTKFNEKLKRTNVSYTYFVPRDSAWLQTKRLGLEPVDSAEKILAMHLVISESPYSIEQLASMTRINNYTDITLDTEGGPLKFSVLKMEKYFIKWNNRYIEVVRPNYECTNGLIHILNGPLTNFKKSDEPKKPGETSPSSDDALKGYWDIVKSYF